MKARVCSGRSSCWETFRRRLNSTVRPSHGHREENPLTQEYVDAPQPVRFGELSALTRSAPPVAQDVTYERILDARSEPQNWLTYYGTYEGQRYSTLDEINTENVQHL